MNASPANNLLFERRPAPPALRSALNKAIAPLPKATRGGIGAVRPQSGLFLGSSAVEQSTVNRLAAGSNPAGGARQDKETRKSLFVFLHKTFLEFENPFLALLDRKTNLSP